ncbi:hypothetical protein XA3_15790 [Xylocopilactobacillus apicola]|uniref:Transposase n=1 Tax=Xylocopilactobacillus apicola TaxID=2932184 RepID=A0AAU9DUH8_9LACO|nr:hypothetical protein XA3_15790 [Xylocopilactobacillus apicola]
MLAVLNINNMIPVPASKCCILDLIQVKDINYRNLLQREHLLCRRKKKLIFKNAALLRRFIFDEPETHENIRRYCCDLRALEGYCKNIEQ